MALLPKRAITYLNAMLSFNLIVYSQFFFIFFFFHFHTQLDSAAEKEYSVIWKKKINPAKSEFESLPELLEDWNELSGRIQTVYRTLVEHLD